VIGFHFLFCLLRVVVVANYVVRALHVAIETHKLRESGVADFADKLLYLRMDLPMAYQGMAAGESLAAHAADFVADVQMALDVIRKVHLFHKVLGAHGALEGPELFVNGRNMERHLGPEPECLAAVLADVWFVARMRADVQP